MLRLYTVIGDNDADAVRDMFSASSCLLNIGTDPDEWWTGPERTELLIRQTGELGGIELRLLASDLVFALVKGLGTFTFGAPRAAALKGFDGDFDLYPVLG